MEQKAREIGRLLEKAGGTPLVVGGFVRDQYLGISSKDMDIEVHGLALEDIHSILAKRYKVDAVGQSFGVLKVFWGEGEEPIDVSVPRRDNKTGVGHTGFAIDTDPHMGFGEAFRRRDLTINALGKNLVTQELVDLYGGLRDLQERRLREVDDKTFIEDPLRSLRAAQFAARFDFDADRSLVELCRKLDLSELPLARVETEFNKLLMKGKKPSKGLQFLKEANLLRFFPELNKLSSSCFGSMCDSLDRAVEVERDLEHMLSVLAHRVSWEDMEDFLCRVVSKKSSVKKSMGNLRALHKLFSAQEVKHMRHLSVDTQVSHLLKVAHAISPDMKEHFHLMEDLALKEGVLEEAPKPFLTGKDLIDLGVKPGKDMGTLLKKAYHAQLEGSVKNKEECLSFIQKGS